MAFTFTVENGTGLAAANAYAAVETFEDHHTGRGRDYSAYADADVQVALVRATDYMDKRFSRRWRGDKGSGSQALCWPRSNAYDNAGHLLTGLPPQLVRAVCEYAWLALTLGTELAPVPSRTAGRITAEQVGPIRTEYGAGTQPMVSTGNMLQNLPEYPEADLWVEELLRDTGSGEVRRA